MHFFFHLVLQTGKSKHYAFIEFESPEVRFERQIKFHDICSDMVV